MDPQSTTTVRVGELQFSTRLECLEAEVQGREIAEMHNNLIEDRPETYYVIEPTPLKVYCPQLEGSVHPPRLKGPWEENVEPFGTYHPIHVCNQHEPTAVLQKEADIPIRPANNETEARELNKALRSAMLQQQRLTTDQIAREMTRYTTDAEEDLLDMDAADSQPERRLSFGTAYRMVWGSRRTNGWKDYHILAPMIAHFERNGGNGTPYGKFSLGHGEIYSRDMKPRRRDCPIPLAIATVQQMLAEASDEAHEDGSPITDFGACPRDHLIEELATTNNFHVVSFVPNDLPYREGERKSETISHPITRIIRNKDDTFQMRIILRIAAFWTDVWGTVDGQTINVIRTYDQKVDGPLNEDNQHDVFVQHSLGLAIHIDIADRSPRAGKSKFYSQNDYALYAWEDYWYQPANAHRIVEALSTHNEQTKLLQCLMRRPDVIKFINLHADLRFDIAPYLLMNLMNIDAPPAESMKIARQAIWGYRFPPMTMWDETAQWEQSVGDMDRSLLDPYSHTPSERHDIRRIGSINSYEYLFNECENGDEDMAPRATADPAHGRKHQHMWALRAGRSLSPPPPGPVRLKWKQRALPPTERVLERNAGRLVEYKSNPFYLRMQITGRNQRCDRTPIPATTDAIISNDFHINQFVYRNIPNSELHQYQFDPATAAYYRVPNPRPRPNP
jgi:hypothetical protein